MKLQLHKQMSETYQVQTKCNNVIAFKNKHKLESFFGKYIQKICGSKNELNFLYENMRM